VRLFLRYLRDLDPRLPRRVWILEAGGLANMFGTGLVIPFVVLYLHNVRGLSLTMAGIAAATSALVSLPAGVIGGAAADRIGAKRTILFALAVQTIAIACFPLIREAWHALVLQALMGVGNGAFWPAQSSILTRYAPAARLHGAFALQRMFMNLGIGLGSVIGGAIARVSEPATFTALFLIDALTFVAFAALVLFLPDTEATHAEKTPGSYREVLSNRPFVSFLCLNTLLIGAGIAPFVEMLPAYAKNAAGVSEAAIGGIFFANTMTIVVLQLPISRALESRRRMPALAAMSVLWAAMWLVVPAAGELLDAKSAAVVLAIAAAMLGLGECLHGPIAGPLVADLAEPHLLGRFMALSSVSWQVGFVIGPAIGGYGLDRAPVALWLGCAAACAIAAAWAVALEPSIPEKHRQTMRVAD
jgi:MFS family permease